MKIKINHKLLSDSPFSDLNKDLFSTPHPSTSDLISDIKNGTPTCYLVSGYRGAGKSSFIKRVEQRIKEEVSFAVEAFDLLRVQFHFRGSFAGPVAAARGFP